MLIRIDNANLFDADAGGIVGERSVTLDGDRIVDVTDAAGAGAASAERRIDARGQFLLPGLIDAHVHLTITTMDFARALRQSPVEFALEAAKLAGETVRRGFTTVRDTGGDSAGIAAAIGRGLCDGPRVVRSGRVLSQTGGHGDVRSGEVPVPSCGCEIVTGAFGHVVDGADAVRKAARHELRAGADFLKIMSSGGVASPMDPFDSIQFTAEEISAATVEAQHRHTYVTSHAYSPEAIRLAADNGVSCIEHGNLLDASTADHLAQRGTVVVPTLVTYKAMAEIGARLGLPERNLRKNSGVFESGLAAVETARAAGVELGFGTDLLGEAQTWQNREFQIRSEIEAPGDVLRSMWVTNPRLCGLEGEIGRIAAGARADLVLSRIDPLRELAGLAEPEKNFSLVIAAGKAVVDRL